MPCWITRSSSTGSTLPPESTATTGGSKRSGSSSSAATAATPAGSTTILARSRQSSSARDIASSETVTTSSTTSLKTSKVHLARAADRDPVRHRGHPLQRAPGGPAVSEGGYAAAALGLHARPPATSGRSALTATPTPATSPPPPVHTSTVRTSGHCSSTSRPTVPCPAMMSAWSNGCTSTAPVSAAQARATTSASSTVDPDSRTSAPYAWVAAIFGSGAVIGMKTVAEVPSSCAASATPCAWLPALAATTPSARSPADNRAIRLYAPRILNDPVRCRFSHFRYTGPPTWAPSTRLFSSGVCRTTPDSSFRAARTSSTLTGPTPPSCHPRRPA